MERLHKKIIAISMIMLMSLTLLAGCSGKNAAEGTGEDNGQVVKVIDIALTQEQYTFGVDKTQTDLLAQVDAFVQRIQEDGTLDAICEKYFSGGVPTPVQSATLDSSKDQLVVATNAGFEPFEYLVGDYYYGIDMELAAMLAEELGQELVIQNMDFDAVCLSVGQQKCDIAMAGLTIKPDREQYVTFSLPYYEASQKLIVLGDDTTFDDCRTVTDVEAVLDTLTESDRIGVQAGTTGQFYVEGDESWGFAGLNAECVPYKNGSLAVQDMINGNIGYVIIDSAPADCITAALNALQGADKWEKFVEVFIEQDGYVKVMQGLKNTVIIAVCGLLIGILIGTGIAVIRVIPQYSMLPRVLDGICSFYVGLFRGTPIAVQLLVCYYVLLPLLGIRLTGVQVSVLVFGLNSGAYISEIMRSGIQSVDPGQLEGGRSVGLSFSAAMAMIVIPQAVKNILPTLGNEFIALIKETSVVSFVGAADLYMAFNYIGTNSYEFMVPYLVMAVIYIVMVMIISLLIKLMERSLQKSDRRN